MVKAWAISAHLIKGNCISGWTYLLIQIGKKGKGKDERNSRKEKRNHVERL